MVNKGHANLDRLKQGVQDIEFLANPGTGELFMAAIGG